MGLDFLEVVLSVERRFNVSLRDDDVTRCVTVADFVVLVASRLVIDGCPSMRGFHDARRMLIQSCGTSHDAIRPDTPLAEVVPIKRRHLWRQLCTRDRRVPALVASPAIEFGLTLAMLVCIALGLLTLVGCLAQHPLLVALGGGVLCVLWVGRSKFASAFRTDFPSGLTTVADLARRLMPLIEPMKPGVAINEVVQAEVCRLIADALGRRPKNVQPNMRLSELD